MSKITATEVAKHRTKDDAWVILFGKVYDVTHFLNEHPGSAETLLEVTGQDATDYYCDIGHSGDADVLLKKLYIGDLLV